MSVEKNYITKTFAFVPELFKADIQLQHRRTSSVTKHLTLKKRSRDGPFIDDQHRATLVTKSFNQDERWHFVSRSGEDKVRFTEKKMIQS